MFGKSTTIKINENSYQRLLKILKPLGLNPESAVELYLNYIIEHKDLPLQLSNAEAIEKNQDNYLLNKKRTGGLTYQDMFQDTLFLNSAGHYETGDFLLGRDINNSLVLKSLADVQSTLIIGQRGSGKTEQMKNILESALTFANPDELKLVLVDGVFGTSDYTKFKQEKFLYDKSKIDDMDLASRRRQKAVQLIANTAEIVQDRLLDIHEKNCLSLAEYERDYKQLKKIMLVIDDVDIAEEMLEHNEDVLFSLKVILESGYKTGVYPFLLINQDKSLFVDYQIAELLKMFNTKLINQMDEQPIDIAIAETLRLDKAMVNEVRHLNQFESLLTNNYVDERNETVIRNYVIGNANRKLL